MNNRLHDINAKLKKIEQSAVGKSPAYKNWLRQGYKLLLEERKRLIKSAKKQENNIKLW